MWQSNENRQTTMIDEALERRGINTIAGSVPGGGSADSALSKGEQIHHVILLPS